MCKEYLVRIVEPSGMRIKGDDYSAQLSKILTAELNSLSEEGWSVSSVFPSMISNGCVVKLLVTLEREKQ